VSAAKRERGCFIVLEGIDGSGTTTQAARLCAWLNASGIANVGTREPTPGPVGKLLRQALTSSLEVEGVPVKLDFRTLALLFAADRTDHNQRLVQPALRRGEVVVSDRYTLSSLLYQSLTAPEGVECLPWLQQINAAAQSPDLVIVLDVSAEQAAARRALRGGAAELFEQDALQLRLAQGYRRAAELLPGQRVHLLDGAQAMDGVSEQIIALVQTALGKAALGTTQTNPSADSKMRPGRG
jgi:dTMP kinase